ncbi:MAG: hypothetical protein Q8L71_13190, partial [Thiobacillus sp.]|nr:hypothetical protein [Thiobacillus sp.]
MPSPPTAYDGLYELSNECWRCCAEAVYMASAAVPRLPLVGNAPGVFDDIRAFLQNVLYSLSGYTISSWIRNTMLPMVVPYLNWYLVEPFQNFISGIRSSLVSALDWGLWRVYNPLSGISDLLSQIRSGFPDWLRTGLTNGLWVLTNPLQAVSNALIWLYQALPSWIRDPLNSLGNQVWTSIMSVGTVIGGCVAALREGIAAAIANAMLVISDPLGSLRTLADWFRTTLPGQLSMIGIAAVTQLWNTIVAGLSGLWLMITSTSAALVIASQKVGLPIISGLWAGVSSIPSAYLSWLASTCGTDLALTPSRALASVSGLYGMAISAGTVAMLTATALNIVPTLNWVGAAQLAGFVSEAAAFDPLTKACYGVLINDALTVPLRYHWNQQLRPNLPTIGEIYTMGRKHGLSMAEFRVAMGYQGIPNWWIDKIYDYFWTDPSPMWLLRMTEGGIPNITNVGRKGPWLDQWIPNWRNDPFAWLRMKLMLAGYEDI